MEIFLPLSPRTCAWRIRGKMHLLVGDVAGERYGIDIAALVEIVRAVAVDRLPGNVR
jgi:chemotaxis signal transduction protein